MLSGANNNVEISWRSAVRSRIAFSRQANALAVPRTWLDAHFQWLGAGHNSFTRARGAAFLGLAGSAALRAGDVELHSPGCLRDVSAAASARTRFRFSDHAFTTAVRAAFLTGDVQAHDGTADGVPETDVHLVFQIAAGFGLSRHSGAASATKHAGENVFESAATAAAAAAAEIRKIEAAEIEWHFLSACAATWKWSGAKAAGGELRPSRGLARESRVRRERQMRHMPRAAFVHGAGKQPACSK